MDDNEDLNEVLDITQRQKRAMILRAHKAKIERARELAKHRLAPEKNIKKRAYAQARQIVRKRFAGARGAEYEKLGPSEKIAIDRAIEKKQAMIKKIALRLIPRVKQAEQKRLQSFRKGEALANAGAPEGHTPVTEHLNSMFEEMVGNIQASPKTDKQKQDASQKKSKSPIVQYAKFSEESDSVSAVYQAIAKKAGKAGIDIDILGEVYDRGMDAWSEDLPVSQQQYAFARVNSFINKGKTYYTEDADLHENAWNQLGQKKPAGNTLPAPARGSVPKHGRKFSEGDHVVPHTGPYAGQVHRVTSSRAGSVNIVRPNSPKYDSITVRAKHEHLSPATPEQTAKYKADREADHKRMFGEGLKDPEDNPCWKGYEPVGTKKLRGKTVPNCVPVNEEERPDPKAKVVGTNCRNCVYWRKDLEKPVTKEELNPNGGLKAPNKEYVAMSKRIDLGTLPGKDNNVKIKGFCDHDSIKDWVTERMCCSQWDSDGMVRDYKGQSPVMEEGESIAPQTTSPGSKLRKKLEVVDRKPPHGELTKQAEIKTKIIDEKVGNYQNDPKKRLQGTDSLVKAYKKDTPGECGCDESLNEAFNIAYAAGVGVTLTAADLGMRTQGAFQYHPSVIEEMERRAAEEVEEEVTTADKAPVVIPAHKDARGNTIPAMTVMRKKMKKIIKSGNVHDGETE